MSAKTTIEWATRSWNPVRGCSRVSPGCDNCYAMKQAHRFAGPGKPYEGLTTLRRKATGWRVDWTGVARFIPGELAAPLGWKKPERIFVNSMSDLLHNSLTNEEIAAVFGVMASAPRHRFLVLTKRPERALAFFEWVRTLSLPTEAKYGGFTVPAGHIVEGDGTSLLIRQFAEEVIGRRLDFRADQTNELCFRAVPWPLPNVWLGVSVEDQQRADERIPKLVRCPAAVRFLSCEPLLGPLDLRPHLGRRCSRCGDRLSPDQTRCDDECATGASVHFVCGGAPERAIDWVIAGGESGGGARPMQLWWARELVRQCRAMGTACFMKQFGAKPRDADGLQSPEIASRKDGSYVLRDRKGGDLSEIPGEWPREFPR